MDDINLWTILAQIINFLVLFYIFKRFLWGKITDLVIERSKKLETLNNVEEDIKNKINLANEESNKLLEQARQNASKIEKDAENLAKTNKEKIVTEAEKQAKSILEWARNEIEKDRLTMINSIKSRVIDLSLKLNEKLFDKEKVNKDFMEKELSLINN